VTGDLAQYALDEHGNARGGIRSPYVDAPTATPSVSARAGGVCGISSHHGTADDAPFLRYDAGGLRQRCRSAERRRPGFLRG
jgi:hypothetical protein